MGREAAPYGVDETTGLQIHDLNRMPRDNTASRAAWQEKFSPADGRETKAGAGLRAVVGAASAEPQFLRQTDALQLARGAFRNFGHEQNLARHLEVRQARRGKIADVALAGLDTFA